MVDCGESSFVGCRMHNNLWGIAVQGGLAKILRCRTYQNGQDGILLQAKGRSNIVDTRSYLNAANGIFIGYDVLSDHVIRGCSLYRNRQNGILRGVSDPQRVVLEGNYEFENRGLAPDMTALLAAKKKKAAPVPCIPERNPGAENSQAKKAGWGQFQVPGLEELSSTMSQRQHQKYMKRC